MRMRFKDIDALSEKNQTPTQQERQSLLLDTLRQVDIPLPTALTGRSHLLCTTQTADKDGFTLFSFATCQYIKFVFNAEKREKMTAFKQLLNKQTPFEVIKEKARELMDAGLHIHTLGIVVEDLILSNVTADKLVTAKPNGIEISKHYFKYIPHLIAIYANDLQAFETVCTHTNLMYIALLMEKNEMWTPIFKMYQGNAPKLADLLTKYAMQHQSDVFQKPAVLNQLIHFFAQEKYPLLDPTASQLTDAILNCILFNSKQTPLFETLFENVPTQQIKDKIYSLCTQEQYSIRGYFKYNRHKDEKTGLFVPDAGEIKSYHSIIKTLLYFAQKYEMQDFLYAEILTHVPPSCLQTLIDCTKQKDHENIYKMLTHPFNRKNMRKNAMAYAAQLHHNKHPFFWHLYLSKQISTTDFMHQMERYATHDMPERIVTQAFIHPSSLQKKPDDQIEKKFLECFGTKTYLVQNWLNTYPNNQPEQLKIIHHLYANKLKQNTISGDELIWLAEHKIAQSYFEPNQITDDFALNNLDTEQFKTLCATDKGNMLHFLCDHSNTAGLKWIYQKHPALFRQWLQETDAHGKTPLQKSPPQFLRKMELRLTQKGDTAFAQIFTDFLNQTGISFEKSDKQQPVVEQQPEHQTPATQITEEQPKQLYLTPVYQHAVAQITQGNILKSLQKTIDYMTGHVFNHQKSYADHKEFSNILRAHRIRNHRLLYCVDFARQKLVLLDLCGRKECYRKWQNPDFLAQQEKLAHQILSHKMPIKCTSFSQPTPPIYQKQNADS